jgi:hypothetical protein
MECSEIGHARHIRLRPTSFTASVLRVSLTHGSTILEQKAQAVTMHRLLRQTTITRTSRA